MNDNEETVLGARELTAEEVDKIVSQSNASSIICTVMTLLFCIVFVLCITYCAVKFSEWKLMWFYLLAVLCYMGG